MPPAAGRRTPLRLAVALMAAVVVLVAPAVALGHAVVVHTHPSRAAQLDIPPWYVSVQFNEPVEIAEDSVRVYDARSERVDKDGAYHAEGDASAGVRLGPMEDGVYTVVYRVVSADGHPVSGGFPFGVGVPVGSAVTPEVGDLLGGTEADDAVEAVYGAVRGMHYAALLLLIGAVVAAVALWPRGGGPPWPRRLLLGAAACGALTAVLGVALQGAVHTAGTLGDALAGGTFADGLHAHVGATWGVRALLWAAAVGLLLPRGRPDRRRALALGVPAAGLAVSLPLAGHADTHSPRALLVSVDVAHVLAAGAWLGGLLLLLVAFWPRGGAAPPADAPAATARFSRIALPAVGVLAAAGLVQAWVYLGTPGEVISGTYGLALLAKLALLGGIVALAAGNRRRTARLAAGESPGRVARALRRAMTAEIAVAVVALAATAVLVRASPPAGAAAPAGPVTRELDAGPLRLQVDVEPARVGTNAYHVYLFDRRTGEQIDRVEELTLTLRQEDEGIGPIRLDVPRKGVAHYELLGEPLPVGGTWRLDADVRVSEFDQYRATTDLPVAG